jgi:hypothetical protein
VSPSPNVAISAARTFYGLPRLGRSCAERRSRRCACRNQNVRRERGENRWA